jgi:hypothetical protein
MRVPSRCHAHTDWVTIRHRRSDGDHERRGARYRSGDWYHTDPGERHAIQFEADTVEIELRFATGRYVTFPGSGHHTSGAVVPIAHLVERMECL